MILSPGTVMDMLQLEKERHNPRKEDSDGHAEN